MRVAKGMAEFAACQKGPSTYVCSPMSTLEMTVEELKSLPPSQLEEAAGYIHRLKLATVEPRRGALARSFGCLTSAEADELELAIAANCERNDANQW